MKISNGLQSLYKPDAYKQTEGRIENHDTKRQQTQNIEIPVLKNDEINNSSLKKVLSSKELSSLNALFGYEHEGRGGLYGLNNLKNVSAGMLLDVKG